MSVIEFPAEERRAQVALDRICADLEREVATAWERHRALQRTVQLWTHTCPAKPFGPGGATVSLDRQIYTRCPHCGACEPSQPPPSAA